MTPGKLYRAAGWTLCVSSIAYVLAFAIGTLLFPEIKGQTSPVFTATEAVSIVASMFFLLALPAVYLYQAQESRWFGLVGFITTFMGQLLGNIGYSIIITFIIPFLDKNALKQLSNPTSGIGVSLILFSAALLLFAGQCMLGLGTLNAKIFPRAAAWLLIGSSIITMLEACATGMSPYIGALVGTVGSILGYAAFGWMGYIMARRGVLVDYEQDALTTAAVPQEVEEAQ